MYKFANDIDSKYSIIINSSVISYVLKKDITAKSAFETITDNSDYIILKGSLLAIKDCTRLTNSDFVTLTIKTLEDNKAFLVEIPIMKFEDYFEEDRVLEELIEECNKEADYLRKRFNLYSNVILTILLLYTLITFFVSVYAMSISNNIIIVVLLLLDIFLLFSYLFFCDMLKKKSIEKYKIKQNALKKYISGREMLISE